MEHTCKNCNSQIPKQNLFCDKSCSAKFNNKARTRSKESCQKTRDTLRAKYPAKPKKEIGQTRVCSICNTEEKITFGRFQSTECRYCSTSLTYRNSCKFKFNLKDYPQEFDMALLESHGMFHPKTNPTGVSRDHLLSVNYGKINRIDPEIIAHPANCRIILQSENTRKNKVSSITYDELLARISDWESKYGCGARI